MLQNMLTEASDLEPSSQGMSSDYESGGPVQAQRQGKPDFLPISDHDGLFLYKLNIFLT